MIVPHHRDRPPNFFFFYPTQRSKRRLLPLQYTRTIAPSCGPSQPSESQNPKISRSLSSDEQNTSPRSKPVPAAPTYSSSRARPSRQTLPSSPLVARRNARPLPQSQTRARRNGSSAASRDPSRSPSQTSSPDESHTPPTARKRMPLFAWWMPTLCFQIWRPSPIRAHT